ncbi:MAG: hypothetical protein PWP41_989 [Moorella sp. (in: firmicutes)]|nr:hypothetical protein [Moorella sp. (in: firmicutes)]
MVNAPYRSTIEEFEHNTPETIAARILKYRSTIEEFEQSIAQVLVALGGLYRSTIEEFERRRLNTRMTL